MNQIFDQTHRQNPRVRCSFWWPETSHTYSVSTVKCSSGGCCCDFVLVKRALPYRVFHTMRLMLTKIESLSSDLFTIAKNHYDICHISYFTAHATNCVTVFMSPSSSVFCAWKPSHTHTHTQNIDQQSCSSQDNGPEDMFFHVCLMDLIRYMNAKMWRYMT